MTYTNLVSNTPVDLSTSFTAQNDVLPGREADMSRNNAGGMVFTMDQWGYLDRFLILGSDKPSYYVTAKSLTVMAAGNVIKCIKEDGKRTVDRIVELSTSGRAPKNDPAVFALALCAIHGSAETIKHAYDNLSKVARIGTHLFQFITAINEMGKWNAATKRGVAGWYLNRSEDKLTLQLLKYQSRNGWSHRDVLRLAHVKPSNEVQSALFRYVTQGAEALDQGTQVPQLLIDFENIKRDKTTDNVLKLINSNSDLTWEMIPTELQRDPDIMKALLPNMGMTALIRKLGQLTNIGVIAPFSKELQAVVAKITDRDAIKKARVHPITILNAMKQYSMGKGDKGSLTWQPVQQILDALDTAFYYAFDFIETTGERYLLAVDCSGSMFGAQAAGLSNITAAEVAGVMALAIAKREPNYWIGGFNHQMSELKISPNMRLDQVLRIIRDFNWGTTNCALPALTALEKRMDVDKIVIITDNETYGSTMQVSVALARYRKQVGHTVSQIVLGTSVTNFTIADPKDPYQLDVVGFDGAVPALVQSFGR